MQESKRDREERKKERAEVRIKLRKREKNMGGETEKSQREIEREGKKGN